MALSDLISSISGPPKLPDPNTTDYGLSTDGSNYYFQRQWSLTLGAKDSTFSSISSKFPSTTFQTKSYTSQVSLGFNALGQKQSRQGGLKIIFDIEKNSVSSSNKSKIQIYNLNQDSRKLFVKDVLIKLDAGYNGLIDSIFFGNSVARVSTERKGPDFVTTFELGDGERELYTGFINDSFPPATPVSFVVQALLAELDLSKGNIFSLPVGVYNNGYVAIGSIKQNLDRILDANGLQWHVSNGKVNIYPKTSGNAQTAIVINQATGMIGTPSQGEGGDNIVQFTSLLNPGLVPGQAVSLTSENFNGVYSIRNCHFEGDTHGNKWQVSCECALLPNASIGGVLSAGASLFSTAATA